MPPLFTIIPLPISMKLPIILSTCLLSPLVLVAPFASAATLTVNPSNSATLTRASKVGVNVEMALTSDQMRLANGAWLEETLRGTRFNILRWGYSAWEWDWHNETPLTMKYWAKYNIGNDAGSFGLREFIAYCKASNSIPLLMIPVEVQRYPETTWTDIKNMATAMASYVNSQGLTTPVYFELGNEPCATVPQGTYEARLVEMSAVIKNVNPAFKLGASVDGPSTPYNPYSLITNVGASFDYIDFHRYAGMGFWTGYYNINTDTLFTHPGVSKETVLGECNILWPDWNGRMANDLQGSLPLLNGLLESIDANRDQYVITWPSHWPGSPGKEPYGLFDYNAWFNSHQTRLFTGPIYAHRMVNENVLTGAAFR
jgi:hypothetical protein